jgi:hypothetical protein
VLQTRHHAHLAARDRGPAGRRLRRPRLLRLHAPRQRHHGSADLSRRTSTTARHAGRLRIDRGFARAIQWHDGITRTRRAGFRATDAPVRTGRAKGPEHMSAGTIKAAMRPDRGPFAAATTTMDLDTQRTSLYTELDGARPATPTRGPCRHARPWRRARARVVDDGAERRHRAGAARGPGAGCDRRVVPAHARAVRTPRQGDRRTASSCRARRSRCGRSWPGWRR